MVQSRARWAETATAVSAREVGQYIDIGELSDKTGLSRDTIRDSLTREKITTMDPRGAIDRPDHHFGGEPLWTHEALAEYKKRAKLTLEEKEAKAAALPSIEPHDAHNKGYASTEEVAELLDRHDQTVRRWQRNYEDYPPAVARRSRDGRPGVPEHVRELSKVLAWVQRKNAERASRGEAPLATVPEDVIL